MKITLDAYAASHRAVEELKKWRTAQARAHADEQVFEQWNRTGPPTGKASDSSDGGIEEFLRGRGDDQRDRVDGEDQEGTVQDWQTRWQQSQDARVVSTGDLISCCGDPGTKTSSATW